MKPCWPKIAKQATKCELLTNEHRLTSNKNTSSPSGCYKQSKQWLQLKTLSCFRVMYIKKIKDMTIGSQTRENLKFAIIF